MEFRTRAFIKFYRYLLLYLVDGIPGVRTLNSHGGDALTNLPSYRCIEILDMFKQIRYFGIFLSIQKKNIYIYIYMISKVKLMLHWSRYDALIHPVIFVI